MPPAAASTAPAQSTDNFWLATATGDLYTFGVESYGDPGGAPLNRPIVDMVPSRDRHGYWMVASDGGIFSYGDTRFFGSTGALTLNKPIVGLSPTNDQSGYWMVASDGGIFSYGDANFYGSTGAITLNKPIVAMSATPDDKGYWLVASDGGVFAFGDAAFYGSTGDLRLDQPIVAMDPTPDGRGYWLVASDGGVFAFGDAAFYGSTAGSPGDPVERLVTTRTGHGLLDRAAERKRHRLRRCPVADVAGHRPPVQTHDTGRPGRALRLPAAGKAVHLGWQRPGGLRLLRTRPRLVGPRRRHRLRPGGRRPVPHGRHRRSRWATCRPATWCSGATGPTTGPACTTPPSTWAETGSSRPPAITSSSTCSTSGVPAT